MEFLATTYRTTYSAPSSSSMAEAGIWVIISAVALRLSFEFMMITIQLWQNTTEIRKKVCSCDCQKAAEKKPAKKTTKK